MIQMDMIGRNEQRSAEPSQNIQEEKPEANTNSLSINGTPFSQDLKAAVALSNQKIGLELKFRFDQGEENLIKRSDHWPFIKTGIPSLLFFTGFHPDYHKSSDTADKINFEKMEKILKLIYLTTWELAERTLAPRFNSSPFRFDSPDHSPATASRSGSLGGS
jgi:Zn-dependent M28 family amino/carboxypeptidase